MNAKNISEVRSIISKVQGKMAQTKAGGGDAEQVKNAVAKMKKVIKKALNKEKALKLESKMELENKKTKQKKQKNLEKNCKAKEKTVCQKKSMMC